MTLFLKKLLSPLKFFTISALLVVGAGESLLAQSFFRDTQGQISLRNESFISPDYDLTHQKDFQFIGGGLNTLGYVRNEGDIKNGLQTEVFGAVSPGVSVLSYLDVSQLFWKEDHLVVGRKKELWSNLDEIWTLGLYQPLFAWNPILPEAQGLTGVFIHYHQDEAALPWGVVLFGSPLFIPDQGSSFEVRDGEFVSSNPYFKAPPSRANINGQEDEINYMVEKPNTEEIVFNRSFAGKVYVGSPQKGFLAQVSFAHKPVNQLALALDGYLSTNNSVEITVLPKMYYHTLASMDLQYAWRNFILGVSGLRETPEAPDYTADWTYAKYGDSTLVSPYAKFRYRGFEFLASYLDISGGESTVEGDYADLSKEYLQGRYPYGKSFVVKTSLRQRFAKGQSLKLTSAYQQGIENEYGLITGRADYQFNPSWSFSLNGQMIRVAQNDLGDKTAYSSFVNNDSMTFGVQYVF